MDITFYNKIINDFGKPKSILKYGKVNDSKYEKTELGYGYTSKFEPEETRIENNPNFIIWHHENCKISITNNYINKITKIEFSLNQ